MKNLLLSVAVLLTACLNVFGQQNGASAYELVVKCGTVSVYSGNNEFRMVIGSIQNPKASFLLGVLPESAASQMDRIVRMGEKEVAPGVKRTFQFCGEPFLFDVSGTGEKRKYSFRGIDTPVKFSLTEKEVQRIKSAVLNLTLD